MPLVYHGAGEKASGKAEMSLRASDRRHWRGNLRRYRSAEDEQLLPSPAWRGCRPQAAGVEGTRYKLDLSYMKTEKANF